MRPPAPARVAAPSESASGRSTWMDSLRVAVVVGVIGSHVGVIYALDVGWWYEERTAAGITTAVLAAVFAPGLLFGMGLMFFVAGWFTPPALERKGARRFVIDRLWRLGIPTAAYLFVVNPALNFFGDRAMGEGETIAGYFRNTYLDDVELGVAWFLAALLMFSLVYAGWRSGHSVRAAGPLQRSDLVKAGAFIAVGSFVVRLAFPVLSGDVFLTLNLWEYPQMVALFALGILARERGWLAAALSPSLRRTCGRAAGFGAALAAVLGAGIAVTDDPDQFLGGLRFEATLVPLVEATLALGMALWLIDWFRRRADHVDSRVSRLGRASFTAYLLHVPVTVLLAIAIRDVAVPAELKFIAVFSLGAAISFGVGRLVTRPPVGGRRL